MIDKRLIVFAPHPDDETLVCGGTIAKKVREGYDVRLVVMTDGSQAFRIVFGRECEITPKEVGQIRHEESMRAAEILGIGRKNIIFLDFEDQELRHSVKPAEGIITEILANYYPDEVLLPYKNDSHRDHKATFKIVTSSLRLLGLKKLVFQYANEQKYNPFCAGFDAFTSLLKHNLVRVDVSDVLEIKKKAINEYRSQVSIMFANQWRPIMLNPYKYLKPKEIFLVTASLSLN